MTEFPPTFHGPRDPGDAWVEGPDGTRMWGRFGSAGLLAVDRERGILLQHRAQWSHFGGTWGIPGGARHQDELAVDAALREANEEADVPLDALAPLFTSVLDLGFWTYTTAAARTVRPFEPAITDAESLALAWVPLHEVDNLPLHPHFGEAWPRLRTLLEHPPLLVIDAANVVGSRPDGWWKDRAGAARRLLASL
ncbi:NUDIX domain-containing protein, partial [Arthrobacter sp.]|uniref:NUDIX domain-containing protein n=1 Tax=Arthrobacter sp. TaxID=1667 RepID=UPI0033975822